MIVGFMAAACATAPRSTNERHQTLRPAPVKTPFIPKNGDYESRGKVTRIEMQGGSVEIDHEEIPGAAPAMKKEFQVSDGSMLGGLKLGDEVNFTLRYNNGQETIVAISKTR
jgi:Cu(I)/Ag(I) efflux system protein CusF